MLPFTGTHRNSECEAGLKRGHDTRQVPLSLCSRRAYLSATVLAGAARGEGCRGSYWAEIGRAETKEWRGRGRRGRGERRLVRNGRE